ncbi:MAG: sigma-70 family RNA polymerase sigma factor [Pseudomonadota bacterium]
MPNQIKAEIAALLPRLRRFAAALSGNTEDGDDIVQTACLKALDRLDQFEPGTRLDSWMFRIVQTTFLDRTRRHEHRFATADIDRLNRISDQGGAARQSEDRLLLAQVRSAIASLPDDQRSVLVLVAIEGFSYKDAAATLDIPVGTVMSRLSRARAQLKPLMEGGQ